MRKYFVLDFEKSGNIMVPSSKCGGKSRYASTRKAEVIFPQDLLRVYFLSLLRSLPVIRV